jgi:hypothetical protein
MWRWYDGVWGGRLVVSIASVGWWLVVALEKKIRRQNTASKYGVKPPQKWVEISEVSRRILMPYFLVTWMTSREKIRHQNTA